MEKFKIIAYIISKVIAFYFSLFFTLGFCFITGIGTPIGIIFIIVISCIPTMIIVKIKEYSFWWVAVDIVVMTLVILLSNPLSFWLVAVDIIVMTFIMISLDLLL